MSNNRYDVAIIGGGIAGLWVHNRLLNAGYQSILLEADRLGCGQTLASQGMIHGGIKYVLGQGPSRSADVMASMPARWRLCLAGKGDLDLSATATLARHSYLWSNDRLLGELGTLLASRMLRGRAVRLPRQEFPDLLRNPAFRGVVYRLEDVIVDTRALLTNLHNQANQRSQTTFRCQVTPEQLTRSGADVGAINTAGGTLNADQVVFAAGAGNAALSGINMQLRGLHQVWLELPADMAATGGGFYGHCITGARRAEPQLTISSHQRADGSWVWYLGGALAGEGTALDDTSQQRAAISALGTCLPWMNIARHRLHTLRINRAEVASDGGSRPDEAHVERRGNTITCWPTKLTLTPDVGDRVLKLLDPPTGRARPAPPPLPAAEMGDTPWGAASPALPAGQGTADEPAGD